MLLKISLKFTKWMKVKDKKTCISANTKQKKTNVAILSDNKVDIQVDNPAKDKEEHFLMIKGLIYQENTI